MGVDLFSMGRVSDVQPGDEVVRYAEPEGGLYKKLVIRDGKLVAGCLLGNTDNSGVLLDLFNRDAEAPQRRSTLLFPTGDATPSVKDLPNEVLVVQERIGRGELSEQKPFTETELADAVRRALGR